MEHFSPAVADFFPLIVGNIYTSEGSPQSDGVPLILLQFIIGKVAGYMVCSLSPASSESPTVT